MYRVVDRSFKFYGRSLYDYRKVERIVEWIIEYRSWTSRNTVTCILRYLQWGEKSTRREDNGGCGRHNMFIIGYLTRLCVERQRHDKFDMVIFGYVYLRLYEVLDSMYTVKWFVCLIYLHIHHEKSWLMSHCC